MNNYNHYNQDEMIYWPAVDPDYKTETMDEMANYEYMKNIPMHDEVQTYDTFYGAHEGFMKGNMFRNLYEPYKNYKPAEIVPKNEMDKALLNLDEMQFCMHELNLFLDVYPNDNMAMQQFVDYRMKYVQALNEFEKKYGPVTIKSDHINRVPFSWEEKAWPWEKGVL